MKWLLTLLVAVGFAAISLPCCAETACAPVTVQEEVEVYPGALSLADLLAPGTCPRLYRLAAQVNLGTAPRAGSVRVLDGRQIGRRIGELGEHGKKSLRDDDKRIPERIVVRQAGGVKSCAEIARFVSAADRVQVQSSAPRGQNDLHCAAAGNIPQESALELVKTTWNVPLQRREFALRCVRPENCIPFLVWFHETGPSATVTESSSSTSSSWTSSAPPLMPNLEGRDIALLVRRGQTAMLSWEQAGIRVVLPVTCLEAGGIGQFVRVRFKNASRTMRAEIVGAGRLRTSL